MAALTNLVHQHKNDWVTVALYGNHDPMHTNARVLYDSIETAVTLGAHSEAICTLVPASNAQADHFQSLLPAVTTTCLADRVWADAAWTTRPGAGIIVPTGDCQTIIIKNVATNTMVTAHGGKPAMTPGHIVGQPRYNILDLCIAKAIENDSPSNLQIYVTGTISGEKYWHDDDDGQASMQPFKRHYGTEVFVGDPKDGRLDLFAVTQIVARRWKVPLGNIQSDGLCSHSHPRLASYRENKTKQRNVTIAVNHPVAFIRWP